MFVYVGCACLSVCNAHECPHLYTHVQGPRWVSGDLLGHSHSYSFDTGFLTELGADYPPHPQTSSPSRSRNPMPSSGLTGAHDHIWRLQECWGPNLDPHTWAAKHSSPQTHLLPHPLTHHLLPHLFEAGSRIASVGLKLTRGSRMALNSLSPSCPSQKLGLRDVPHIPVAHLEGHLQSKKFCFSQNLICPVLFL